MDYGLIVCVSVCSACIGLQPEHNMGLEYKARVEQLGQKRSEARQLSAGAAAAAL